MSIFALVVFAGMLVIVASVLNRNGGTLPPPPAYPKTFDEMTPDEQQDYTARVYDGKEEMWAAIFAGQEAMDKWEAEQVAKNTPTDPEAAIHDIVSALVGLGWKASDSRPLAEKAVACLGPDTDLETLVKYALNGSRS